MPELMRSRPLQQNSPPEKPALGILFMLDEKYCDLIPAQNRFENLMNKAAAEGKLVAAFNYEETKH